MACSWTGSVQVVLGFHESLRGDGWAELRLKDGSRRLLRWLPREPSLSGSSSLKKGQWHPSVIHETERRRDYISLADSMDWEISSLKMAQVVVTLFTPGQNGSRTILGEQLVELQEKEFQPSQSYRLQLREAKGAFSAVWIETEKLPPSSRVRFELPSLSLDSVQLIGVSTQEELVRQVTQKVSALTSLIEVVRYSFMSLSKRCPQEARLAEYVGHIADARALGLEIHQLVQAINQGGEGLSTKRRTEIEALISKCGFQPPHIKPI